MENNNKNLPALLFVAVFAIFCAVSVVYMNYSSPKSGEVSDLPLVKVYVKGEVKKPGVYEMKVTDRVEDAIKKAGGVLENGDASDLDLANFLQDGETIVVSVKGQSSYTADGTIAEIPETASKKININTASKERLMTLDGIGESLAERIIAYRSSHGPFGDVNDILNVSGIGKKKLEAVKDYITVN